MSRRASGLGLVALAASCHATEVLPPPPPFEDAERSGLLFIELEPGEVRAFAWDAESFDPSLLPRFTADRPDPRLVWVTFACDLATLGLDGPLELAGSPGTVRTPEPVRSFRLRSDAWRPSAPDAELLGRLPVTTRDRCRAQASSFDRRSGILDSGRNRPDDLGRASAAGGGAWTVPLADDAVLVALTSRASDAPPSRASSVAFVADPDRLEAIARGELDDEAAYAEALTARGPVTGLGAVRNSARGPTGEVAWVRPGRLEILDVPADPESTAEVVTTFAHPSLDRADRVLVDVARTEDGLVGLVLVAETWREEQHFSTLLGIEGDRLVEIIGTATVTPPMIYDLVRLPDGEHLVRGSAPVLVESDRLLRIADGSILGSATESLPLGAGDCRIRRGLGPAELYVATNPGCDGEWFDREAPGPGASAWAAAPERRPATATASIAGARLDVERGRLIETREAFGRCEATEVGSVPTRYGAAPPRERDWTLFGNAPGRFGAQFAIVEVTEPGPRCTP